MAPTLLGRDDAQKKHEFLYWEFHVAGSGGIKQAVRMGDWKAVRTALGKPLELYNLKEDIGEEHNVADSHPDIIKTIEILSANSSDGIRNFSAESEVR